VYNVLKDEFLNFVEKISRVGDDEGDIIEQSFDDRINSYVIFLGRNCKQVEQNYLSNSKGKAYDLEISFDVDGYVMKFNISDFLRKSYDPTLADTCILNLNIEYYDPDIYPDEYTGRYQVILGDALLSRYYEFHLNFERNTAAFSLNRPVPPKPKPNTDGPGVPGWAIALIVLGSIIVVGGIAGFAYLNWKKKTQSGLKEYGRLSGDVTQ
jgi:hypothetical protein